MARSFNGSSDFINISSVPSFSGSNPFTIQAWANLTVGAGSFPLIADGLGVQLFFGINLGAGAGFNLYVDGIQSTNGATVTNGTWYHVLGTYNGSNSSLIYVNGVHQGSTSGSASPSAISSVNIGKNTGGNSFWKGGLADFAIWTAVLTQTEITALSSGVRPYNIRKSLLNTWLPLDGLQSPEIDYSGNASNGTLTGTSLSGGPPLAMLSPRSQRTAIITPLPSMITTSTANMNLPINCVVVGNQPEEKKSRFVTDFHGILKNIFRE